MSAIADRRRITRPVMRYHGGKWRIAPFIIDLLPPHRCYVEPFAGASSVLLRKPRSYSEVLNDLDGEIVNVFRVLRDPVLALELKRVCELTPFSRVEFEDSYLSSDVPVEQARRTLLRSWFGVGSPSASGRTTGFRSCQRMRTQVPPMDWARWPALIPAFVDRLRGVVIECRDAVEVIGQQDTPETVFYVDPPYVHSTRTAHGKTYRYEMTDEQHRDLAAALHSARGMVILSGYECPLYDELYSTWQKRHITALTDAAKPRAECVWLSPAASDRLPNTLDMREEDAA